MTHLDKAKSGIHSPINKSTAFILRPQRIEVVTSYKSINDATEGKHCFLYLTLITRTLGFRHSLQAMLSQQGSEGDRPSRLSFEWNEILWAVSNYERKLRRREQTVCVFGQYICCYRSKYHYIRRLIR